MKYLKRSILTLAIAVIPFHSYVNGCGGDYYDYMNYYNLFDQLLLENKGLQPFLLTTDYAFYGEDTNPDAEQQPDENLNAWMTFFKKNNTLQEMDTAQFKTLLYSASYQSLKQPSSPYVIALNKTDAGKQTLTYLQYAKELEPYAQLSENDGWWDMKRAASPSEETYAHYKNKGLELIDDIYFQIGKVPGLLAAPGWSEKPAIAAVMKAKAAKIDGLFPCMALVDINTEQVKKYADVNMWKNGNNYTGNNQIVCWPCAKNGDMVFHLSTHIMGIIGVTDGNNDDVPYQSPSNQTLQATGLCLKDGSEVNLNLTQANLLNEQGIVTGLNFSGGWKSWGNFTGAYPGTTDVKDMFICVRRMFNWQYVTFILTNWQKTDKPITPRLVKTLVDSEQVRLNGLTSRGYLLGASVQFLADENPTTDLLAGIFRIHTKLTPPVPAQDIEDTFEYDVSNFEVLFS